MDKGAWLGGATVHGAAQSQKRLATQQQQYINMHRFAQAILQVIASFPLTLWYSLFFCGI